jgi:hypothetical protein
MPDRASLHLGNGSTRREYPSLFYARDSTPLNAPLLSYSRCLPKHHANHRCSCSDALLAVNRRVDGLSFVSPPTSQRLSYELVDTGSAKQILPGPAKTVRCDWWNLRSCDDPLDRIIRNGPRSVPTHLVILSPFRPSSRSTLRSRKHQVRLESSMLFAKQPLSLTVEDFCKRRHDNDPTRVVCLRRFLCTVPDRPLNGDFSIPIVAPSKRTRLTLPHACPGKSKNEPWTNPLRGG